VSRERDDDRTVRPKPYSAKNFQAVDVGQPEVDQDRVERFALQVSECLDRRTDAVDGVAIRLQQATEGFPRVREIVDHEDAHRLQHQAS
jgi:hypothetical protein